MLTSECEDREDATRKPSSLYKSCELAHDRFRSTFLNKGIASDAALESLLRSCTYYVLALEALLA